jgi:hypothetical protein
MRTRALIFIAVLSLAWPGPLPAATVSTGPGDLLKLACPAGSGADHPCRAVYFWGADGKRHAFPNAATYFTWYPDFSGVKTVDAAALAALSLGRNITFRPGKRLLKIPSAPAVYAVEPGGELRPLTSEAAAAAIFGPDWNKQIDDLSEAFVADYRFGADINSAADYSAAGRLAAAPGIDAAEGASYEYRKVTTAAGSFDTHIIMLDRARYQMKTLVAATADCTDQCAAKPLADYAKQLGAGIAIHGSYFCPPDYADCAGKTYSFLWPVFDSASRQMRNSDNIKFHEAPIIAAYADGRLAYYRRANAFASLAAFEAVYGSPIEAALANYPGLVENGDIIVESEPRLEDAQRTVKGTRGAIGFNQDKIFLVVAKSATVIDLAGVMLSLGAADALNLDGGGSAAIIYGGAYKIGPGRLLPNAIVFTKQ